MKRHWLPIALLSTLLLIAVGCSSGDDVVGGGNQGQVQIVMSAGAAVLPSMHGGDEERPAFERLQSANVTFSSIMARTLDGELIDVSIDLPQALDLLSMLEGRSLALPIGFLPAGTYDQMVVVMTALELTATDGTVIGISPSGGVWTAVVDTCDFEVVEGEMTTVELTFRHDRSFVIGGHEGFDFEPDFECDED